MPRNYKISENNKEKKAIKIDKSLLRKDVKNDAPSNERKESNKLHHSQPLDCLFILLHE
jgi:hypothetical protein